MPKEYNWKPILYGAVPISIIMIFVFNASIKMGLKWFYLGLGMLVAAGITYYFDKKKHNIFTSSFVVALAALIIHALNKLGFI